MEFVRPGTYIDFMRHRKPVVGLSLGLVALSIISMFAPGPNFGIDFAGGTELQVVFGGNVEAAELRETLEGFGHSRPDVVKVEGEGDEYIIRVREVTTITEEQREEFGEQLGLAMGDNEVRNLEFSPGGDKVELQFSQSIDVERLRGIILEAGLQVRTVNTFGRADDFRYEAQLVGIADELVQRLGEALGDRGPSETKRVEWVGPKAGQQLREAAIQSLLYAVAFIMVYVAFRFDLRFAPGGVVAMTHDVVITFGIYVLLGKEVNLTTVAALLTILGYSINDTIVVYDRIRENMGRLRDRTLSDLINISTSQMLSRTIVTSGTTLLSMMAFFISGTPVIQDIAFALFIGILVGTFSSVYVAAPVTEWMDSRFFRKA